MAWKMPEGTYVHLPHLCKIMQKPSSPPPPPRVSAFFTRTLFQICSQVFTPHLHKELWLHLPWRKDWLSEYKEEVCFAQLVGLCCQSCLFVCLLWLPKLFHFFKKWKKPYPLGVDKSKPAWDMKNRTLPYLSLAFKWPELFTRYYSINAHFEDKRQQHNRNQ